MSTYPLPETRAETAIPDKKPLYTESEAIAEANRCIYCADAPCIQACPTDIDIPTFIHKISTGNIKGAARTIFESNLLGYSCARVCPVEVLCAGDCVYNHWNRPPIEIGRLQRYATETALTADADLVAKTRATQSTGKRVALIGAGPASLAAAGHLALEGHTAVIFERKELPGGLNTLGVAPYKLHAEDSLKEIAFIQGLGDVQIKTGVSIVEGDAKAETEVSTKGLLADYDAVFIGIGLGTDHRLNVPGEEGPDVHGATDLIERLKAEKGFSFEGKKHAVIVGGGNTAIDAARELALLGVPEVTMVYRRDATAMSGYAHEMAYARKEGVRLLENRQPVEILRDGDRVTGVRLAKTEDGRTVEGETETLACDLVSFAIGQARLTGLAKAFDGVALDNKGRVLVDETTCRTGNPKVYAGGDCVNGGKEVVNAAQHGKLAARAIHASFGTPSTRNASKN